MIKVLVNGARGRMGSLAATTVRGESDLELVGETDLGDRLKDSLDTLRPAVVIDFTHPDCVVENTNIIIDAGCRPVIGTTGFQPEDIRRLEERCAELGRGGIIAPNFAIGAVLLMKFASEAARFLPAVEIIEMHHEKKADAPSGTAIKTAEMIHARRGEYRGGGVDSRETIPGVRGGSRHEIPIHSVRLPGLVAHQEALLGGAGEVLTIRHDSLSRECFMPGVVLAVRKVMELDRLVYGLENILEL